MLYKSFSIVLILLQLIAYHLDGINAIEYTQKRNLDNLIRDTGIRSVTFKANKQNGIQSLTNLDNFRNILLLGRKFILGENIRNIEKMYKRSRQQGKMQKRYAKTQKFPCDLTVEVRSIIRPTDVNYIRPGDIDVIGAIGDSLTAGNGLMSENILHIASEHRGPSFAGGGMQNWHTFLTLPNILKVFNPNLYGYSLGDSLVVENASRLNVAEPMIMSRDMPFQARVFINRLRTDLNINMQLDWKLLTIFVGNNDICSDMCHHDNPLSFLKRHEIDLRNALTLLRKNVPRLIVNLLSVPNLSSVLSKMKNIPLICQVVLRIGCHCVYSSRITKAQRAQIEHTIMQWQQIDEYVASLPEYHTKDFTVLYQPFVNNATLPTYKNGDSDLRWFASDCFHFSQLGHAAGANTLWNNMLQPFGKKQSQIVKPFEYFECPTREKPYIATLLNSFSMNKSTSSKS